MGGFGELSCRRFLTQPTPLMSNSSLALCEHQRLGVWNLWPSLLGTLNKHVVGFCIQGGKTINPIRCTNDTV